MQEHQIKHELMKQITTILIAIAIPTIPFFAAYIHLHEFYSDYGISINQWADQSEMLVLCFGNFAIYAKMFLLVALCSIPILWLSGVLTVEANKAKSQGQRMQFIRMRNIAMIVLTIGMLLAAFFEDVDSSQKVFSAGVFSIVVVFTLVITIKADKLLKDYFDFMPSLERQLRFYLPTMALMLLFVHSSLYAFDQKDKVEMDNRLVSVTTNSRSYAGLKYLGKTKTVFFFLQNEKPESRNYKTLIIYQQNIKEINLEGKYRSVTII